MDIGNKIRKLRKQRGITQEQLAESIGVSFQAVSKWENNIALPDITLAPVLAGYFSVSMDELFDFNLKDGRKSISSYIGTGYNKPAGQTERPVSAGYTPMREFRETAAAADSNDEVMDLGKKKINIPSFLTDKKGKE